MDEAQIRREARAEAFEEVWLLVDEFRKERAAEDYRLEAALLWNIGDRIKKRLAAAERATRAPKPTVRYTEAPEPETPPAEADGFTTEHATGWPKRLIPDWPDSYPFEALGPWPGADGGRDGA
jgi:hypothetical protein